MSSADRIDPESVRTREDFVRYVAALAESARNEPDTWENANLPSYLEAASAWAADLDGFFRNRGESTPEPPTWATFAMILAAARIYE